MMAQVCSASTWEAEAGGPEYEVKLNYIVSSRSRPGCVARSCLENKSHTVGQVFRRTHRNA